MSVGVLPKTIVQNLLLGDNSLATIAQESLAIAQQEQVKETLVDQNLELTRKSAKSGPKALEIEAPKNAAEANGFYDVIIAVMVALDQDTQNSIDSAENQLRLKRAQLKNILDDKIRVQAENKKLREEAEAVEKKLAEDKKRMGIWGGILDVISGIATAIVGAATTAIGVISANPVMIAGGVSLVVAGGLDVAAGAVSLNGGNQETHDKLKKAATGFLVAGIVLTTFGAGTAMLAAKTAAKEGAKKAAAKKSASDLAERTAQKNIETIQNILQKSQKLGGGVVGAAQAGLVGVDIYLTVRQKDHDIREAEIMAEIKTLGAQIDADVARQEYLNKLVQLLRSQLLQKVLQFSAEAMTTLNEAIEDQRKVSTRLASSFRV